MGLRDALKLLLTCFRENDTGLDELYPPRVPTVKIEAAGQQGVSSRVRFEIRHSSQEQNECPVNLCESVDDLDNDCIAVAETATANAAKLNVILDLIISRKILPGNTTPRVGPKPRFYNDAPRYELE